MRHLTNNFHIIFFLHLLIYVTPAIWSLCLTDIGILKSYENAFPNMRAFLLSA